MVQIDSVWWMNANLSFLTETSHPFSPEITSESGRLYTYPEAKNVCPSGWELPSLAQFDALSQVIGKVNERGNMVAPKGWSQGVPGHGLWLFHKTGMSHKKRLVEISSYNFWLESTDSKKVNQAQLKDVGNSDGGEELNLSKYTYKRTKAIRQKRKMAVRCVRK